MTILECSNNNKLIISKLIIKKLHHAPHRAPPGAHGCGAGAVRVETLVQGLHQSKHISSKRNNLQAQLYFLLNLLQKLYRSTNFKSIHFSFIPPSLLIPPITSPHRFYLQLIANFVRVFVFIDSRSFSLSQIYLQIFSVFLKIVNFKFSTLSFVAPSSHLPRLGAYLFE